MNVHDGAVGPWRQSRGDIWWSRLVASPLVSCSLAATSVDWRCASRAIFGAFTSQTQIGTASYRRASPLLGRTNQPRQRDRVMVELLRQPDLPDTDVVGAPRLQDDVVDDVDGMRVGIQQDSVGHAESNRHAEACYSDLIGCWKPV